MMSVFFRAAMLAACGLPLFVLKSSGVRAQVPASPPINQAAALPEVVVDTSTEGNALAKKPTKAPAAAQQTSTPRASVQRSSSSADGRGPDTSDVAVSPTGLTEPVNRIASSVTVITAKEIEAQQRRTLPDVLKGVPGLNVVQSGGPGGQTSIFMRGTNANHTKVLIDGIDVSDPTTPNRTFDFGQLLATDIERVEILRGPQSGLYGADALGGVILIYTKRGKGPPKAITTIEGGSFGTFNQTASVNGGTDAYNYSFNVSHYRADDVPVTPFDSLLPGETRFGNRFNNWTYSTKLGFDLSRDVTLNFVTRYTDGELHFTGDDAGFPSHPNPYQSATNVDDFYSRGEVVWQALNGGVTSYFGINYTNAQTENIDRALGNSYYQGDRVKYDWRSVIAVAPGYTFVTGADHQIEQFDGPALFAEEGNNAAFAELQSEVVHNLFVVGNARFDDNDNFGGHSTWRVAPAYVIEATGTKLKGSIGTGFKAPSLSQRFQDFPAFLFFGNPNLKPEESTGYDAGFEQAVFAGRAQFGATYFRNDISQLIQGTFDPVTFVSTLINVGKAKTEGVEAFVSADLTDEWRVRADYTYTDARDENTGAWLLRRPFNKASINVGWTPTKKLLLTASLLAYGESLDIDRSTFANVILPAFAVVNIAADYKLTDTMSLFGRIDNVFDEHYEIPDGFLATGIGVYGGLRFSN